MTTPATGSDDPLAVEALPLAERALAITEAAYGPGHPDVGRDLSNLALIWQDLGRPGRWPTGPGHRRGRLRSRPPHRAYRSGESPVL